MSRERMPDTRRSVTHKAVIHAESGKVKFFVTVGLYADGRPGEIFLSCDESGSTLDGFADAWAMAVSLCLQAGVSLETLVDKFSFLQFEPRGMTECEAVRSARSVVDYAVRWMASEFGAPGGEGKK